MSAPYANILNRVNVLKKNLETLIEVNKKLSEANKRLNFDRSIVEERDAARDRVLQREIEKLNARYD